MVVDEYLLDNFFMECLRSPAMLLIAINAIVSKSLPKGENITLDVEDILKKS